MSLPNNIGHFYGVFSLKCGILICVGTHKKRLSFRIRKLRLQFELDINSFGVRKGTADQ